MKYRRRSRFVDAEQVTAITAVETGSNGTTYARPGDWILRGEDGEIWVCCDSVFHEYYEPVEG